MRLLVPERDAPGLYRASGPGGLAGLHPAWAADMARFGPLVPVEIPLFSLGEQLVHQAARPDNDAGPATLAVAETGSTMDLFWALSGEDELPGFTAVVSAAQTAARGQLRRPWDSGPGNLHVTLALPRPSGPEAKAWDRLLPLLAGEIVAQALEEIAGPVLLKWPNDLVVGGRKVGGLLLEERAGRLALGLGLNLDHAPDPARLRGEHALVAGILKETGPAPGPLGLWSRLEKKLFFAYVTSLENSDPDSFVTRIQGRLLWLGRPIMFTDGNKEVLSATLAGLSPDGGLRLTTADGGERIVHTGGIGPGPDGPAG